METLYSIESLDPNHVLNTGCRPLLVYASDMQHYLVKYAPGEAPAHMLCRELLAANFCEIWGIPFPKSVLLQVRPEHLSPQLGIGHTRLNRPGFATLYDNRLKEVDRFWEEPSAYQAAKFINPEDFLKIAFFDLWISNDDRHISNYNMMIRSTEAGYSFVAIDHGACFHSGNQDKENYPITLEESILKSPILRHLYRDKQLFDIQFHQQLHNKWYICALNCIKRYPAIISSLPESWNINKEILTAELTTFMMDKTWFDTCWRAFIEHLQILRNH